MLGFTRVRLTFALAAALVLTPAGAAAPVFAGGAGGARGAGGAGGAGGADLLPDLQMAPIFGLELTNKNGRKRLRFGTIVYNVGDGAIEIGARDRSGNKMRRVNQRVYRSDGSVRTIWKPEARAFWAGDGHFHWHIARFNEVTLTSLAVGGDTAAARYLRKIGFCLVDTVPVPGWDDEQRGDITYFGCGRYEDRKIRMGISLGWGDVYAPETAYQSIDVTDVPAGSYRICAVVNPRAIWTEKANNFSNNFYWMDIQMNPAQMELQVTGSGDTAC